MEEEETIDAKEETQAVDESNEAVVADVADQRDPDDKQERNFKALRDGKEQAEKRVKELEAYFMQIQPQLNGVNTKKPDDDPLAGDEDDWTTKKEMKKLFSSLRQEIDLFKVSSRYPDAENIIKKYGHEVNPILANAIGKTGDLAAAVEACKATPSYIKDMMPKTVNKDANRAIDNANKPKSALGTGTTAAVAKGAKYASMSSAERIALMDSYIRGG